MSEGFKPGPFEIAHEMAIDSSPDSGLVEGIDDLDLWDDAYSTELVSDYDKEKLEKGLAALADYLVTLPPSELPSILLFPETSARPLAYVVKPLFRAIYSRNAIAEPKYLFVKTPGKWDFDAQEAMMNMVMSGRLDLDELSAEAKNAKDAAEIALDSRATEIVNLIKEKQLRNKNMLIIDDFSSSKRTTATHIRNAMEDKDSAIKVSAFAFLSSEMATDAQYDVLVGSLDEKQDQGYPSFDYRSTALDDTRLENITGVTKKYDPANQYASRSDLSHADMRAEFRARLAKIGQDFVEKWEHSTES